MKKFTIKFNNIFKVQKLKRILKKVHSKDDDQIKNIVKFLFKKNITPQTVDRAELEIFGKNTSEIVTIAKESLSFMFGGQLPFTKVTGDEMVERQYVILPWNLDNPAGTEALRAIISKISTTTRALKYTVYVDNSNADNADSDNLQDDDVSISELSLSEMSFGGQTVELFEKIESLEHDLLKANNVINENELLLNQRQNLVDDLGLQLSSLNTQSTQQQTQINNLTTQTNQRQTQINSFSSQLGNLNAQVNSLTTQRNNLQNQLQNANNDQMYTMQLTGSQQAPGIYSQSIDFGAAGVLSFAKPIHLTIN